MKIFKQLLKWIGYLVLVCVGTIVFWFLTTPQFGGTPSEEQLTQYGQTDHHDGSAFFNYERANMDFDWKKIKEVFWEFTHPGPNSQPKDDLIPLELLRDDIGAEPLKTKITWFGHSSFLVEMDGKVILLDPMFGQQAAPHPWLGSNRYNSTFPIDIQELPRIDIVVFSHDHYDHLDYGTVEEIKDKVEHWLVPLGMNNHLTEWGVEVSKITTLDWWEESVQNDIEFVLTPSRHFSGRGLTDRQATLWGSWVIQGATDKIYFSGDGGYGDHFKKIGEKYGPFDIGLMECGQYNYKWADIHMMPEESVQAAIDVQAKVMMPIHWGAFTLSVHSWIEPVERASEEAQRLGVSMTTPEIGEPIILNERYPEKEWWLDHIETPIN